MIPAQIEDEISRLMSALEDAAIAYGSLCEQAGLAEVAHKVAYARVFAAADGPMAIREQVAVLATERQLTERRVAEARVDAMRQMLMTYRTQIEGARTIAANIRAVVG